MSHMFRNLSKNDRAISPVIGTILMVAATVIIAGAVYAAVNAYGGKTSKPAVDASWKAQSVDADNDGLDDTIKITYLAGPSGVNTGSLNFTVQTSSGSALTNNLAHAGTWSAGDYGTYKLATPAAAPTTVYVTISQSGNTVLDQTVILRQ